MADKEPWPPKSARQALLSSPSGRRKYADFQSGLGPSPIKSSANTPSLADRLRLARTDQDFPATQPIQEDDDDDEETLQLKLAAIEAKLKLKKLQNKAKKGDDFIKELQRHTVLDDRASRANVTSEVKVALSPIKRPLDTCEPRSPSRVMLGIDKGIKGADVSLRRAQMLSRSPVRESRQDLISRHRPASVRAGARIRGSDHGTAIIAAKSFSERMADSRERDRKRAEKRDSASQNRTRGFKIDAAEIESFKQAAGEELSDKRARSPSLAAKNMPGSNNVPSERSVELASRYDQAPMGACDEAEHIQGDASLFEGFSGLHLSTRILPHSFLRRTLPTDRFKMYRIPDMLKCVTSPAYELPDDVGDFVVFGVVASKSNPLDQKSRTDDSIKSSDEWQKKWEDGSQNRKKFMAFTLTDLKWTIDLYLFDTAVPRYHRLSPGTVVAILNPTIMPPKKGREDTGAFSLALHNGDDTVLEIGSAQHLGYCNAKKKDGSECGSWIDSSRTEICEWHLNAQITKTQAARMGVNSGANGFRGGRGQSGGSRYDSRSGNSKNSANNGRGFDRFTGAHYYVASSMNQAGARSGPPAFRTEVSTARMLDLADDPFIAEGQFVRDSEARMQKRLAAQEKERKIASTLATLGDGASAGARYMKKKADGDQSLNPRSEGSNASGSRSGRAPVYDESGKLLVNDLRSEIGRKRTAEDVRLSPVKKRTRFLTSKGIKEAGRESLGVPAPDRVGVTGMSDDDDDDDLDIV